MRNIFIVLAGTVAVGAASAQVGSSGDTYLVDVEPARYAGPSGQRLALSLGDQPRHVAISDQDEICVRLERAPDDSAIINARVRVLRPAPHAAALVRVAGPDVTPGTFRSTPSGMLLRVVADPSPAESVKIVSTSAAPVCTL